MGDSSRWIVPYADFITLMFAFFVVMYSISSVNDGKFRVLSSSMVSEFNSQPQHRPVPIDLGGLPQANEPRHADTLEAVALDDELLVDTEVKPFDLDQTASLSQRDEAAMAPLIEDSDVVIRDGRLWLEVELPTELLFASGRADLSSQATPILKRMAKAVRNVDTPIRVEGFTDNVPIHGGRFSSNWQFSAARAAAVVDHFSLSGVDPELLSAGGFGEFHPIAENDSEQGRNENRRVAIAIAKHQTVGLGGPVASLQARTDSLSTTLQRVTQLPSAIGVL